MCVDAYVNDIFIGMVVLATFLLIAKTKYGFQRIAHGIIVIIMEMALFVRSMPTRIPLSKREKESQQPLNPNRCLNKT